MEYVQNIGSWSTFDEYFKISYGKGSWQMQTQALLSTSKNDYSYVNRDYKENIYNYEVYTNDYEIKKEQKEYKK